MAELGQQRRRMEVTRTATPNVDGGSAEGELVSNRSSSSSATAALVPMATIWRCGKKTSLGWSLHRGGGLHVGGDGQEEACVFMVREELRSRNMEMRLPSSRSSKAGWWWCFWGEDVVGPTDLIWRKWPICALGCTFWDSFSSSTGAATYTVERASECKFLSSKQATSLLVNLPAPLHDSLTDHLWSFLLEHIVSEI